MTTARKHLVSDTQAMVYHIVSRCVRGSWLCGKHKGKDYAHRKDWLIERMNHLAQAFAVQVHAYAIMSNHFHLVVFYDPTAAPLWSDEEVVDRWLHVCPPKLPGGETDFEALLQKRQALLSDPAKIEHIRKQLGSLSTYMKFLKQPIARRANREDQCSGHFFEQRFYSAALLDEAAILAAMAYVDLNPIRAQIADSLEQSDYTSIAQRLRDGDLDAPIQPVVSGLIKMKLQLNIRLGDYVEHLQQLILPSHKQDRWREQAALFKKKQRAYGSETNLINWLNQRGMQLRESPLV